MKNFKANFLYVFKTEDIRDYAIVIEPYQMRTKVIQSYDKEVNSYNLFYEMSENYKNENSPIKEHKSKI